MDYLGILKKKLDARNLKKLTALGNPEVLSFVSKFVKLCSPQSVFVRTDSQEDINYIRGRSIELGEEKELQIAGHTIHFDGYNDQARDKKNTKYLFPKGTAHRQYLNSIDSEEGLGEIKKYLKNIYQKLGVTTRTEAVSTALKQGLILLDEGGNL